MVKEDYSDLEKRIEKLEKQVKFGNKKEKKEKRLPSAYNVFIGKKIKELKKDNPNLQHKEYFSQWLLKLGIRKKKKINVYSNHQVMIYFFLIFFL